MNKILTVFLCVLGLAVACIPAYASPTDKKITVACSSSVGEVVTGDATVTLCDTLATCTGAGAYVCPEVTCDSSATPSAIITCTAPFKVHAMTAQIDYLDNDGGTAGSAPSVTLTGKGFFTAVAPDSTADTDGDTETVSLTVK